MFIQKDGAGKVTGVANSMQFEVDGSPQAGWIDENVPEDHPDVVAFFNKPVEVSPSFTDVLAAINKDPALQANLDAAVLSRSQLKEIT